MASRNKNKKNKKNKRSSRSAYSKSPVQTVSKQAISQNVSISQVLQMAMQHFQAGELQQAETIYKQVLALDADNVDANQQLGVIAYKTGRYDDAIRYFQKVIQINPEFIDAHYNLGLVYKDLGNHDASIASNRKALSLNPNQVDAHINLGNVLKESGQIEEAIASFKNAIQAKPNFAESYYALSCTKKFTEFDEHVQAMQALYKKENLSDEQKVYLCFGLGKAFEDLKEYNKAFDYFLEANRLKRKTCEYLILKHQDFFTRIKNVFTSSFFTGHLSIGNANDTPIFILGMPRSGTSLVEQILVSHSQVHGAGELYDLQNLVSGICSAISGGEFPECMANANIEVYGDLGESYIEALRKHSITARYITDKMPANFVFIGLIKAILPNAKIIHCMRDPMDTCLSIFKNYFRALDSYAYDMTELGQYYNLYLDLMDHWRAVLPGVIYEIKYEDVVSDQENQTRKLLEYCGLPWDEACLSFHKTKRKISTVSAAQVRRPIYTDSVQLWKRYEAQLAPLHKVLFGDKKNHQANHPEQSTSGMLEKSSVPQMIQMAMQHHQAGKLLEAETIYRRVLGLDPDNADANHLLGLVAHEAGKHDVAIQLIQKAIQINPNLAEAHNNLGLVYRDSDHFDASIASYREAISINPGYANAYVNLGISLVEAGQLDEAIASYRKAISIKPDFVEPHFSLAYIKKHTEVDNDVRAMQVLYSQKDISDNQKIYLSFALGKVHEDIKDYVKAFDYFLEANRLKRMTYEYSISQQKDVFSKIKGVFSKSFFANNTGTGDQDNTPVFIIGMPRSGTSLVEQILASHPQVFGAGELRDLKVLVNSTCLVRSTSEYPVCVLDFDKEAFKVLGGNYIEGIRSHSADKKYITDKMPDNFRMVGLIKAILPNAKVIHCMRDPMDTCLSIFKNNFHELEKYAYKMTEIGEYYNLYLDLMDHWRTVLPGFIYEIKYETLVSDQVGQTRKFLKYCGLPWDDACMSYHKTKRNVTTVSAVQVRRPIYSDSVQLWKRYEPQLAPLNKVLFGGGGNNQASDPGQSAQGSLKKSSVAQLIQIARQQHQAGQLQEAGNLYRQILALDANHSEANHLLGVIAHQFGKNKGALPLIQKSIQVNPNNAQAHNNLGLVYQALGQMGDAIASHRKALAIKPELSQAHYNLGNALKTLGQTDEAIASYRQAISINPDYVKAYTNLGVSLVKAGQLDEAIASQQRAISISPDFVDAWRNLGNVLRDSGQLNAAEAAFKKALALLPDDPDTLFSWALLDLQKGDFEEGWQKYECRFQAKKFTGDYPELPVPRWQGQPLNGKKLFVWAEQGIGDVIQFVRYLEKLKEEENVQIWLSCRPVLHRLLQSVTHIDKFAASEEVTAADYHVPLMSFPVVYKTTLDTIPQHVPYVYPVSGIVEQWKERLQDDKGFRVGLSWAGNPGNESDVFRSIQLKAFSALMSMPGVSNYSLQKGAGSEQIDALEEGMKLVDTMADQTDLLETAGLIANLDLVITVDTAIAHLVGAMGKPVWMCLSANPDWRWMLEREDSPWYPTMRLYRQERLGEWEPVIQKIKENLRELIKDKLG